MRIGVCECSNYEFDPATKTAIEVIAAHVNVLVNMLLSGQSSEGNIKAAHRAAILAHCIEDAPRVAAIAEAVAPAPTSAPTNLHLVEFHSKAIN